MTSGRSGPWNGCGDPSALSTDSWEQDTIDRERLMRGFKTRRTREPSRAGPAARWRFSRVVTVVDCISACCAAMLRVQGAQPDCRSSVSAERANRNRELGVDLGSCVMASNDAHFRISSDLTFVPASSASSAVKRDQATSSVTDHCASLRQKRASATLSAGNGKGSHRTLYRASLSVSVTSPMALALSLSCCSQLPRRPFLSHSLPLTRRRGTDSNDPTGSHDSPFTRSVTSQVQKPPGSLASPVLPCFPRSSSL